MVYLFASGFVILILLVFLLFAVSKAENQKLAAEKLRKKKKPAQKKTTDRNPEKKQAPENPGIKELWAKKVRQVCYFEIPENYCSLKASDISDTTIELIRDMMGREARLPASGNRLLTVLSDPDASSQQITEIATTDPILTAKILQVANSAYYGFNQEVTSLKRAVLLLGYNNIRTIVMQDMVSSELKNILDIPKELWVHSMAVYSCAFHLMETYTNENPNEICTSGIMHDIGKYFMPLYCMKAGLDNSGGNIIEEEEKLGINHSIMGYLILKAWNLPDIIAKTVLYHHHPYFCTPEKIPSTVRKHAAAIALSDSICSAIGFSDGQNRAYRIQPGFFKELGTPDNIEEMITPELIRHVTKSTAIIKDFMVSEK